MPLFGGDFTITRSAQADTKKPRDANYSPRTPRFAPFQPSLQSLYAQGCALDPDEKAFFYRSWLRPETDAEEQRRIDEQRHLHDPSDRPAPHYKTDPLIDG